MAALSTGISFASSSNGIRSRSCARGQLQSAVVPCGARRCLLAAAQPGRDLADAPTLWDALLLDETRPIPEYMQSTSQSAAGNSLASPRIASGGPQLPDSWRSVPASAAASDSLLWQTMRQEAKRDAAAEPILSSSLYASLLSHDLFEQALAFVLAKRISSSTLDAIQLGQIFLDVLLKYKSVASAARADVCAVYQRDPACTAYSQAMLYFKGFQAIQVHRIAHVLHVRGERVMAAVLQSRMSEAFQVDIHPGARFGAGILLDHGTGVVIGETVVLGNNVSILHGVTLGGTGKDEGDRHPKVQSDVLIGACARVLGNIRVGRGAQVAAGSTVLRAVPPYTLVAGSPAREVAKVMGAPAHDMDHLAAAVADEAFDALNSQEHHGPSTEDMEPPEYLI